MLLLTHL